MTEAQEQRTPIERPLMRSDLNELRQAVEEMGNRQMAFLELAKGFTILHDRVQGMDRKLWAPTIASTIVLLLTVIVRLL